MIGQVNCSILRQGWGLVIPLKSNEKESGKMWLTDRKR